jgi:uncharacterized protein YjbI with pentapeptide repeats
MQFLGKINRLEYRGLILTLSVTGDGRMLAQAYSDRFNPEQFAFQLYGDGDGWFRLLAHDGRWLTLRTQPASFDQSCAVIGQTSPEGTRFKLACFKPPANPAAYPATGTISLSWGDETGKQVGLKIRPFSTMEGWFTCQPDDGQTVDCQVLAPGVPTIRETKSCVGANFRPVGGTAVDLSGAVLAEVDATRAVFSGAKLRGTDLRGSNLTKAKFSGATLEQTDFRTPDDAHPTVLAGADFSGCVLDVDAVSFPKPVCTDSDNPTVLRGATIDHAVLDLDWSNLELTDATVTGIPKDDQGRPVLNNLKALFAVMPKIQLQGARLRGAVFVGADLSGANLTDTDLSFARFDSAWLGSGGRAPNAANLSGAVLFEARFPNALLTGVQFIGAYLFGAEATVAGSTMPFVRFTDAYLANMDFSNVRDANMQNVDFTGACLVNCTFNGSGMQPFQGANASFDHACLHGADFGDSQLYGSSLHNAAVAKSTGSLPVTLTIDGRSIQFTVPYGPTVLPPPATSSETTCPSGATGPCSGAKLDSPNAPTQWPAARARSGETRQAPHRH